MASNVTVPSPLPPSSKPLKKRRPTIPAMDLTFLLQAASHVSQADAKASATAPITPKTIIPADAVGEPSIEAPPHSQQPLQDTTEENPGSINKCIAVHSVVHKCHDGTDKKSDKARSCGEKKSNNVRPKRPELDLEALTYYPADVSDCEPDPAVVHVDRSVFLPPSHELVSNCAGDDAIRKNVKPAPIKTGKRKAALLDDDRDPDFIPRGLEKAAKRRKATG